MNVGGNHFGGIGQPQGQHPQMSENGLLSHQLLSHVNGSNLSSVNSLGGISLTANGGPIGNSANGMMSQQALHAGTNRGLMAQSVPQPTSSMMSSLGIGVETPQSRTLWIGDIGPYVDENFLHSLFAHTGEVTQVKVIRDKNTGLSAGYGFVEFANHFAAKRVLEVLNGQQLPTGDGTSLPIVDLSFHPC